MHLCLFRDTLGFVFEVSLVIAVVSMLKSGNKSEKNLATEFENDFKHNKNNRLKRLKCIQYVLNFPVCVAADLGAREI